MAMFDAVRKGFQNAVHVFEGKREITEENIDEALKAIRMALFEADVNFRVVKTFLAKVKEKSLGEVVHVRVKGDGQTLTASPGDVFTRICHDELEELMGPVDTGLTFVQKRLGPTIIMMVGLQGAGKTTTAGKLARWVRHHNDASPLLVACDVYRPAAVDQLKVLGEQLDVPVFFEADTAPPEIAERAIAHARQNDNDVVIIDTAGRLAVDDLLMTELEEIVARTKPQNILLVVDAMIGQDAVNTANEFNKRLELDGFIMTKLDGDARGGAALSIKEVTGKPIKFVGMGEGMDSLQEFQPAGFADRVLGMGDIRSLVGRMENIVDKKDAAKREGDAKRMLTGEFDFYDFLEQIKTIKKLGSLTDILDMMPFGNALPKDISVDDNELVRIEAMIQSMTKAERHNPELIKTQVTRQRRIARGSGRTQDEVKDLVQRFDMMRGMLSSIGGMGGGAGGMLSRIPGFKQLSQMNAMKNMDMGAMMQAMGGDAGAAGGNPFAAMGGGNPFAAMGGGNPFAGMPGMGGDPSQAGAPKLPPGFNPPGVRMTSDDNATRSKIDREKARNKARKSRQQRKKSRKKK